MTTRRDKTERGDGLCDLHCHLLYGLDDGARTLNESLEMARILVDLGFSEVAPSPHARREYPPRPVALERHRPGRIFAARMRAGRNLRKAEVHQDPRHLQALVQRPSAVVQPVKQVAVQIAQPIAALSFVAASCHRAYGAATRPRSLLLACPAPCTLPPATFPSRSAGNACCKTDRPGFWPGRALPFCRQGRETCAPSQFIEHSWVKNERGADCRQGRPGGAQASGDRATSARS